MIESKDVRCYSLLCVLLLSLPPGMIAGGPVETVLHTFAQSINSVSQPIVGRDGNLYGCTRKGGANNAGVFYRLSVAGDYTELYQFTAADGRSNVIQGADGNFYATSPTGGASQNGLVYRLTAAGERTVVFDFGDGSQGKYPASIRQTGDGDFYGVFQADPAAAATDDAGDVYRLTAAGALTTVYRAADHGGVKADLLTLGSDGSLYGVPTLPPPGDSGALVKIVPGGDAGVLYHFSPVGDDGVNTDGSQPGPVVVTRDGVVYGTTSSGGANGNGTFFRLTPDGTLTVLRAFDALQGTESTISYLNFSLSFQGQDGNFYGVVTEQIEGIAAQYRDVLFRLAPDGTLTFPSGVTSDQISIPYQLADGSFFYVNLYGHAFEVVRLVNSDKPHFFNRESALGGGIYDLTIYPGYNPTAFGYYAYLSDPHFIYHFDLGFEYVADGGSDDIYLYDFASGTFFYTGVRLPFPYLYDFTLKAFLYYYPDTNNPGHYTSSPRYFYNFASGKIITK